MTSVDALAAASTPSTEFHIVDDARTIERDMYRLQTLILPEHVGCHVDAPSHVQAERPDATVDMLGVTALWGRAAVGSDSPTCDMAWVDGEPTAAFGPPIRPVAFVPR